jgi:hypothetical protein
MNDPTAAEWRPDPFLSVDDVATWLGKPKNTLTICDTLVFVKGQGFFRQPWTKSDAGYRMVVLPQFAVGMILARKLVAADNPMTRSSPPDVTPGCRPTTSAVSGARPARTPTSRGSPPTPSARPWPPSSRKRRIPRAPQHSLGTGTDVSHP